MKFKLLLTSLLFISPLASAEFSTAYTSSQEPALQTPAHFEHVFGSAKEYEKEVIVKDVSLDELLGIDDVVEPEPEIEIERSASYLAWKKFCENGELTKDEYLIIDEGNMPLELLVGCKVKGKALSTIKSETINEVENTQKAEEIPPK